MKPKYSIEDNPWRSWCTTSKYFANREFAKEQGS